MRAFRDQLANDLQNDRGTGVGGRKTGVGGREAGIGRRESEDGRRKTEDGGRWPEVRVGKREVGDGCG